MPKQRKKKNTMRVFFPPETPKTLEYVVIAALHRGKWVYVRHGNRDTYEMPGGRIEAGETPREAAKRELYEESGAAEFTMQEVCCYGVERNTVKTYGMIYFAQVARFGVLPDYEIKERALFESAPPKLTYPEIQPLLMERVQYFLSNGGEI